MKDKTKDTLVTALKSYVIGATMTVPGVSGGSMAMVLGIYDRIISAVPSIFSKDFKKAFLFLLVAGCSGLIGALSASPVLKFLLSSYYMIVMYFFLGAIVGSIPMIVRKSRVNKSNWANALFFIPGMIVVILISLIPEGIIELGGGNVLIQIICGIGVSIGFVLPGISFSYLLVVLGLYEGLITYLSNLDFLPLIPLCIGLVIGIVGLAGLLKKAMEKCPTITFPIIMGFVLGSLPQVFPGLPNGISILWCLLTFIVGAVVIWATSGELQYLKKGIAK
ncbi:MAG: DUF368 domain-containing protein [Spirochaetales bacterium]|nr:DUF368 domain-containing protein [Spirochaetales bacterium]